jgi:hypothetical protein
MSIEMNMNYDKIEEPSIEPGYDDEILEAGWNPAVGLVPQEQHAYTSMPPDLTNEVIDLFLRKMYSMQR